MEKRQLSPSAAIKEYFERDDAQAPGGGRKVTIQEQQAFIKETTTEERKAFAGLCCAELGAELKA